MSEAIYLSVGQAKYLEQRVHRRVGGSVRDENIYLTEPLQSLQAYVIIEKLRNHSELRHMRCALQSY